MRLFFVLLTVEGAFIRTMRADIRRSRSVIRTVEVYIRKLGLTRDGGC